jgi:competence protein ComEC
MPIWHWLCRNYHADKSRRFFWLPVAMGLGIFFYFSLPAEPDLQFPVLAVLVLLVTAMAARVRPRGRIFYPWLWIVLAAAIGFCLAGWRSHQLQTVFLAERIGPLRLSGVIQSIDRGDDKGRIVLTAIQWPEQYRGYAGPWPQTIRLKLNKNLDILSIGQTVRVLALLSPPSLPVLPGSYDFARQLYFERIGAVGFALGNVEILTPAAADTIRAKIETMRDHILRRVFATLDGDQAAVAAALMTSEQSAVSPQARADLRQSGLQHILSVSGLHLTIVSGLIFLLVRLCLLWTPRMSIWGKKIAALAAIAASFFYLLISGFDIPTQRAFVMVALVFLAILVDREPLSMRLVALAAIFVLCWRPESILGVSFQLSFAAVIALIAAYESWPPQGDRHLVWYWRVGRYFLLAALTALIASIATAPLIAYHFQQLTLQGILANALAAPLSSFWLMPMVVLSLLAWPFGLEAWPIMGLGQGVEWLLALARWAAGLPGSQLALPRMPEMAIILLVLGGLWMMLWQQRWRYLGLPLIVLGIFYAAPTELPDIIVNNRGNLYAVRLPDGGIALSSAKRDKFSAEAWLKHYGQAKPQYWDEVPETISCDGDGCVYHGGNDIIAFPKTAAALFEDCAQATIIITEFYAPHRCRADLVIDRNFIETHGAVAVYLRPQIRWHSNRSVRGQRPWSSRAEITEAEDLE